MSLTSFQPVATLGRGASPYDAAARGRRRATAAERITLDAPEVAWEAFVTAKRRFLSTLQHDAEVRRDRMN
jgi:hypothetical protein